MNPHWPTLPAIIGLGAFTVAVAVGTALLWWRDHYRGEGS